MSSPLACVVCSLDPQATSLIVPFAQAAILAAPVILRAEIRKGVRLVRARRAGRLGATAASRPPAGRPSELPPDR